MTSSEAGDPGAVFDEAALQGRLTLQRCRTCQATIYYPRPRCPKCLSDDAVWVDSAGIGTVYAWTIAPGDDGRPVAIIDLDEGVRVTARLLGDPGSFEVGAEVVWSPPKPSDAPGVVLQFTRAARNLGPG